MLAYKIEKMAGPTTGDSATQNVLQKFWIFNSPDSPPDIDIYDSQVIYGKEYTYKITAYTLVLSHKYKILNAKVYINKSCDQKHKL